MSNPELSERLVILRRGVERGQNLALKENNHQLVDIFQLLHNELVLAQKALGDPTDQPDSQDKQT